MLMSTRFELAYFRALKSVTKKHRRHARRTSPGLPGIAQRVPGSERKKLIRAAKEIAEKRTNYIRDGYKHTMRGTPGNALIYMFSSRPDETDLEDMEQYVRRNGVYLAQVDDTRGYDFEPGDNYRISGWSGSFEHMESYIRKHLGSRHVFHGGGGSGKRVPGQPTAEEMAEMDGNQLMTITLDIMSYGAELQEGQELYKTFKDALSAAEDFDTNF